MLKKIYFYLYIISYSNISFVNLFSLEICINHMFCEYLSKITIICQRFSWQIAHNISSNVMSERMNDTHN